MSFVFKWPRFSDDFHRDARQMLEVALNKGNKPPIIADKIEVIELEMGSQPPELEIRDIGDLTLDQFRGIFRFSYTGDAHIVLRTKVQANPLNHKRPDIHLLGGSRGMLAAHQPLVVPMHLRLANFKLNAYVVLVVSKQKGITLVFKTDPLQNVDVNSTFDSIAVIQKYIQREIEGQLREMFREDLPSIIHRLSQRWVTGRTKIETPYRSKYQQCMHSVSERQETMSTPETFAGGFHYPSSMMGLHPAFRHSTLYRPLQHVSGVRSAPNTTTTRTFTNVTPPVVSHEPSATFPDIENFDPTYGLRPDDLPAKSGYSGFGRLFGAPRGLRDLAEEPKDNATEWDEVDSFDMADWDETIDLSSCASVAPDVATEYETLPAVGGGTITRPRVYHSQSLIWSSTDSGSSSTTTVRLGMSMAPPYLAFIPGYDQLFPGSATGVSTSANFQSPLLMTSQTRPQGARARLPRPASFAGVPTPSAIHAGLTHRSTSPESGCPTSSWGTRSHPSQSSSAQTRLPSTPPPSVSHPHSPARLKLYNHHGRQKSPSSSPFPTSESIALGSPPDLRSAIDADGNIVLRPDLNNNISQLSTLSHSNHTLSPYTRSLEHFTVRTVPHRASGTIPPPDRQPTKAKRKRTYYLKRHNSLDTAHDIIEKRTESNSSPPPPSEFEPSDVEHYFPVPPPSLQGRAAYQDP